MGETTGDRNPEENVVDFAKASQAIKEKISELNRHAKFYRGESIEHTDTLTAETFQAIDEVLHSLNTQIQELRSTIEALCHNSDLHTSVLNAHTIDLRDLMLNTDDDL